MGQLRRDNNIRMAVSVRIRYGNIFGLQAEIALSGVVDLPIAAR